MAVARKQTAPREILLWMTPSEAPQALQASECSELLDPIALPRPAACFGVRVLSWTQRRVHRPHRLVVRTSRCGRENPGSTPDVDRYCVVAACVAWRAPRGASPAIAQLVEHLTVDACSNRMVPGSIPGGRMRVARGRLGRSPRKNCKNDLDGQT